jgi:ubiquinone/menaquinone biosynthesis C-methylase UbiE
MNFLEPCNWEVMNYILASPCCKAALTSSPGILRCTSCGTEFAQTSKEWVNLYPDRFTENGDLNWKERQHEMVKWYRDLVTNRDGAVACFRLDYNPYASLLAEHTGRILDLGGGIGLTRHFLPAATGYVVLDPSLDWLSLDWSVPSDEYPSLSSLPCFVRGVGEQLPFCDASFHSALALWSLNHVRDPAIVFEEVHRVVVPKGRFLAILEDMLPRWRDVLLPANHAACKLRWPRVIARKAYATMFKQPWPLKKDHIRILEQEIANYICNRFEIKQRKWIGQYLAIEFIRI